MVRVKEPTPTLQAFCIFDRSPGSNSKMYLFLLTLSHFFHISIHPVICLVIFVANFRELALPLSLTGYNMLFKKHGCQYDIVVFGAKWSLRSI
jgi:hypothetical protein